MKTIEQIANEYKSETFDGRDLDRLAQFIPENMLSLFGLELKEEFVGKHKNIEFTRENIINQLKKDVEFGFEKALDKRGISASLMFEVVSMWNFILEEGLENFKEYENYGLPLFKKTAIKYGFYNPIGNDSGSEYKYSDNG
ncbi:MAG TPA: hypothetical protein VLM20_08205 [Methylophilaceae bacterium]|nr:hypothetical protein [Methylophilaceae bacterium]